MSLSSSPLIILQPTDNVGVSRFSIEPGFVFPGMNLKSASTIPRGHKIALSAIRAGEPIFKYGQIIGVATQDIAAGEHVHTQNLAIGDLNLRHEFCVDAKEPTPVAESKRATFMGYLRKDKSVGTRNYIAIISSVNCSATVSRAVAAHYNRDLLDSYPNVDGVIALTHGGGCAINTKAEGYRVLTRTIAGYAVNPNVGGVVMIGLGCETNQIPAILAAHGLEEGGTLRTMTIQAVGGTRKAIEAGIEAVGLMLPVVNAASRTPQPASALTVGLECGGSDGYSGISANPALGYASDLLVSQGGGVVLSETPEVYGAEHLLTRRAATPEVAGKLLERIEWWKDYSRKNDAELDNNPSHGNKVGGLTTVLEKSLGGVAKSGSSRLEAVYEYAEHIAQKGFVFMDTPGYDPVAVTGQIAGGCNLIVFTTGRGSTVGYKPAPCIKLATNTPMYEHLKDDMDLDCGGIVTGESTIQEVGVQIFDKMLSIASGNRSRSEEYNYGDNEFVPWQLGAVM